MTSFLGDDCHTPFLFLKMKFLRTHFHLRLTRYAHIDNCHHRASRLYAGPDNPAQTLDSRSEQYHNMLHELDEGGEKGTQLFKPDSNNFCVSLESVA